MIYSCKYNKKTGRIYAWCTGSSLANVSDLKSASNTSGLDDSFGLVSKVPQEIANHAESWALQHLRVKSINKNGSVEVEWIKKKNF